jgi:hypothetical protein
VAPPRREGQALRAAPEAAGDPGASGHGESGRDGALRVAPDDAGTGAGEHPSPVGDQLPPRPDRRGNEPLQVPTASDIGGGGLPRTGPGRGDPEPRMVWLCAENGTTKTCGQCGRWNADATPADRVYDCRRCGAKMGRDVNGARSNTLAPATALRGFAPKFDGTEDVLARIRERARQKKRREWSGGDPYDTLRVVHRAGRCPRLEGGSPMHGHYGTQSAAGQRIRF